MKKSQKLLSLSMGAALLAAGGVGLAYASGDTDSDEDRAEYTAFMEAPVSLTQAINIAQQQTTGQAMSAEFEEEDGVFVYEVEVLNADGVETEIIVDAQTGNVLAADSGSDEKNDDDDENSDENNAQ